MATWIALLRAINVGDHTVKMDRLRALFEALDFTNVATFIASGNVIFDTPSTAAAALERKIEQHLKQSLGYDVATFLRSPTELAAIARYAANAGSATSEPHSLYVAFLHSAPPADAKEKLLALQNEVDQFQVHEREVYWVCRTSISKSAFSGAQLEKTLGVPATLRNVTTVHKLAAKYPAAP